MSDYLDVNRIEFSVTYRCNSHCVHCHVEDRRRRSCPAATDRDLAVEIVRKVAQAYRPNSLMTFGGEPLLYPDVVCAIHAAGKEGGIPHRDVITNAGIPRSGARAREVARRLAESGVTGMWISVDAFHQEHIPLEVVERNVRAYADAGIPRLVWNPCWVVSGEDDNPWNRRTQEVLAALAHLPVEPGEGNVVQPDGHAKEWLADYLPAKIPLPGGSCEDVAEVTCIGIEPDGGVDICWEWTIGNAAEEDILEILDRYDPYEIPEAKALLEGGVATLADLYRAQGVEPEPEGYYSICDMCRSLRRAGR
jgi:pyruvate-formate lyase-activating enzyme